MPEINKGGSHRWGKKHNFGMQCSFCDKGRIKLKFPSSFISPIAFSTVQYHECRSIRTWSPRAAREEATEPEYDRPLVLLDHLQGRKKG